MSKDIIRITDNADSIDWREYPRPQCVVTSPPYWRKREYPIDSVWHGHHKGMSNHVHDANERGYCRCGAWFGQLGWEETPQEFVEHLVDILVSIPLANDGIMWLVVDDTYANQWNGKTKRVVRDVKPKDLALVPERLAIELQDSGYYIRSRVVWHKTNGMPHSVKDRPQHFHETIWMVTRQPRYKYRYDNLLIPIKPHSKMPDKNLNQSRAEGAKYYRKAEVTGGLQTIQKPGKKNAHRSNEMRGIRDVWDLPTANNDLDHIAPMPSRIAENCILVSTDPGDIVLDPFAGTGTVLKAALRLGRRAMGIDMDPDWENYSSGVTQGITI